MTRILRTISLALLSGFAAAPAVADCSLWLQFDFGRAELTGPDKALLDKVAAMYPGSRYAIEGHADAPGTEFQNLVISRSRAENVADHLAGRGVAGVVSLTALGQSEMKLVAHGRNEVNRRGYVYVSPCSEPALTGS